MTQSQSPIALFVYNRPDHAGRVLDDLSRCRRIEECDLHVFCDGPKDSGDRVRVLATRRVVRDRAPARGATIIEREQNMGLMNSIIEGVTQLCVEHGRVIVVEDDLRLGSGFLDFMLSSLDRYEKAEGVYQVSGFMFPVSHPQQPDSFFLPLTTTWGWATWDRAWRVFNANPSGARELLADEALRHRFDLDGCYPYGRMLLDRLAGRNDSWGILWAWSVFRAGGLTLHPRKSFVHNAGFDGSGTHCGDWRDGLDDDAGVVTRLALGESVTFPTKVEEDREAFARITAHLRDVQQRARERQRASGPDSPSEPGCPQPGPPVANRCHTSRPHETGVRTRGV